MGGKGASGRHVRMLEPADGLFRRDNVVQNAGLPVRGRVQRVVRLLPLDLQHDERVGEVADFHRKLRHGLRLPTRAPGPAVLQRAAGPMPCRVTHRADEQVGRRCRQTVEHRVVRRADGAAQPRLGGRSVAGFREGAGDFHQVMRVHGASAPGAGSGLRQIILRAAEPGTAPGLRRWDWPRGWDWRAP